MLLIKLGSTMAAKPHAKENSRSLKRFQLPFGGQRICDFWTLAKMVFPNKVLRYFIPRGRDQDRVTVPCMVHVVGIWRRRPSISFWRESSAVWNLAAKRTAFLALFIASEGKHKHFCRSRTCFISQLYSVLLVFWFWRRGNRTWKQHYTQYTFLVIYKQFKHFNHPIYRCFDRLLILCTITNDLRGIESY